VQFLVLVGAFLAVAVFFLPSTLVVREASRDERTVGILDRIETAVWRHAEDTQVLPASLPDLVSPACVPAGWCGPYLAAYVDAAPGGFPLAVDVDGFGTTLGWTISSPTTAVLRSAGPDRISNSADDLVRTIDVTGTLRSESLHRIVGANGAIRLYLLVLRGNRGPWLQPSWPPALARLRSREALDQDPFWDADAWGDPFVKDPNPLQDYGAPGNTLQKVTSSHL
jgi:hypothetical protein